ncbi:MAG: putative ribosomal N-acetyltransferase YdaF [Pseudomonas sp.]|nr:MAG: putative ribosomal N-acetyltransferase YdaF [Pseudomonas sp.]
MPQPFFTPASLTTPRLALRPPRAEDWRALFAIWSDAEAMRYFSFPAMTHAEQAIERFEGLLRSSQAGEDLVCIVALPDTGEVIGTCDLFNVDVQCRRAEIGFTLNRAYWGKGYMREAASAVIEHAFGSAGLRRIEADIDPRNTASAGLLERLGFVREGLLRERWMVGSEISDSALYGLLNTDKRRA